MLAQEYLPRNLPLSAQCERLLARAAARPARRRLGAPLLVRKYGRLRQNSAGTERWPASPSARQQARIDSVPRLIAAMPPFLSDAAA